MGFEEKARPAPEELPKFYDLLCRSPSDINEHLPLLRALGERCEHITEFGVRGAQSTTAFLMARPKVLVSWDIDPQAIVASPTLEDLWAVTRGVTDFQPRVGDSTRVEIEETDLLFIDSLHTGKQLQTELRRHGMKARKFIVLHDTETFGEIGEDGKGPGLVPVIRRWRCTEVFPAWRPVLRLVNNNGLSVLQREKNVGKDGAFDWQGHGTRYKLPGARP